MIYKLSGLSLLLFSLLLVNLISCGTSGTSPKTLNFVEKTDFCLLDSTHSYEIYIPARNDYSEKLPLLVIIDAHGAGKFALNKFKQAARYYPAILVASNLIKNGFGNYESAMHTLIADVHQKYPAGQTVFMSGFSGGARMALGYAQRHPLNGLILCGALADAGQINALYYPVISICGMADFNFLETAQYLFQEQLIPGNLKIELTSAVHSWPDSMTLTNALGFLQLSSADEDIPARIRKQQALYCENQLQRINDLKKQGDFLKAVLLARNMSFTTPFNSNKMFASVYDDLKTHPRYRSQLKHLKSCLAYEINARQPYINAFITKDSLWWRNEIKTIDNKIRTEQDAYTNDMYRRIKAFWGIACYSLGNQAVKEHNMQMLNQIIPVYRMLEPENPDMLYFSAFPYFWKGKNEATLSRLQKAREHGFSDIKRLKKDFPADISSKIRP